MNATYSLTRREEKLGATALVVAIIAVLLWGQVAPFVSPIHINHKMPVPSLENESARIQPAQIKGELPQLQSSVWSRTPADT